MARHPWWDSIRNSTHKLIYEQVTYATPSAKTQTHTQAHTHTHTCMYVCNRTHKEKTHHTCKYTTSRINSHTNVCNSTHKHTHEYTDTDSSKGQESHGIHTNKDTLCRRATKDNVTIIRTRGHSRIDDTEGRGTEQMGGRERHEGYERGISS